MFIAPLLLPLQFTFVTVPIVKANEIGWVMACDNVAVQPLASITVTVYVLGARLVIFCVVAPLLHAYVKGVVPPATFMFIAPLLLPLQFTFVTVPIVNVNAFGWVMACDIVAVHPLASVTVTVYVLGARLVIF